MNLVVADTSPLNYLVLIDAVHVLPRLYGRIVIPAEVVFELAAAGAPPLVRVWATQLPEWIEIRHAPAATDPALSHLDMGERSAILLAQSEPNVLLLIDEAAGRLEASRRGIRNTGTLGVLRAAAIAGQVDLPAAISRLAATNFRISRVLLDEVLAEDAARGTKPAGEPAT
jgi:predicted nucleic acid-binding protein